MNSIVWKKLFSKNGLLYLILDQKVIEEADLDIISIAKKIINSDIDIIQLRAYTLPDRELLDLAAKLRKIINLKNKIFIVNNRIDIAYLSGANGVHLGVNDVSPFEARKILGKKAIVGKTIHSLDELAASEAEPVDYYGFGPVFKTKTKPNLAVLKRGDLKKMLKKTDKQIFAIGGINLYNINSLIKLKINNVAVTRDILLTKNIKSKVKEYKKCLKKAS